MGCNLSTLQVGWRLAWAIVAVSFGVRAIIADQLYLSAWRPPFEPAKLELAAKVFPQERLIATSLGYFYLIRNEATEEALTAVRKAATFDPAAADLAEAQMLYAAKLGYAQEATDAFVRLKRLAPKSDIVRQIEANQSKD